MAMLYPTEGLSKDLFQHELENSATLPSRPAALLSVPVHALQRHDTAIGPGAHGAGLHEESHSRFSRRGHSSSGTAGASGHKRAATMHEGGRGNGGRSGSKTSRPWVVGSHVRSKSGLVGTSAQRPGWGVRSDNTLSAKQKSLQSVHSLHSVSINRTHSVRSVGSVGAGSLHSSRSTHSKSVLQTGGSQSASAGIGPAGSTAKASSAASMQRARAGAKLAARQVGRGPSFGAPPSSGHRSRTPNSRRDALTARRPSTARPAASPSPLKSGPSLSASHGGSMTSRTPAGSDKLRPDVSGSKLPSVIALHSSTAGSKLRSATSAASLRSTASGSSRIAAVPAHASHASSNGRGHMSKQGSAAYSAPGGGTHSNSSSGVQLRHVPTAQGSVNVSDNIFASVDHSNVPDNLSDVISSELPCSPSGAGDTFASGNVHPFLPMFPGALGGDAFPVATNPQAIAKGGSVHSEDVEPVPAGRIFQNLPEDAENGVDSSIPQLSHASSQFVRGKLAAGLTSPAPKGSGTKLQALVAAQMHNAGPTGHVPGAAAVHLLNVQEKLHVDDLSARLANPHVCSLSSFNHWFLAIPLCL
jgi:hypothetical protein